MKELEDSEKGELDLKPYATLKELKSGKLPERKSYHFQCLRYWNETIKCDYPLKEIHAKHESNLLIC